MQTSKKECDTALKPPKIYRSNKISLLMLQFNFQMTGKLFLLPNIKILFSVTQIFLKIKSFRKSGG